MSFEDFAQKFTIALPTKQGKASISQSRANERGPRDCPKKDRASFFSGSEASWSKPLLLGSQGKDTEQNEKALLVEFPMDATIKVKNSNMKRSKSKDKADDTMKMIQTKEGDPCAKSQSQSKKHHSLSRKKNKISSSRARDGGDESHTKPQEISAQSKRHLHKW